MICCFCKNNIFKYFDIQSYIRKKTVSYFFCKHCKSIHQYPLPSQQEINNYYDSYIKIKKQMNPGYLDYKNIEIFFKERDMTLSELYFDINNLKNSNNVELGCANGQFLLYLQKKGAEKITGIDISNELIKSISLDNINLIKGSDISMLKENSIDNLFLFNILEHIPDIDHIMNLIKKRLKKTGNLIIEVPLAGFISRRFKNKWRFIMPDEHVHIPSIKGLKILLKEYGMHIIESTRFGSGFTTGSINNFLKNKFDFLAKKLLIGDRGAFLIKFIQ